MLVPLDAGVEEVGLRWLFQLRGPLNPPRGIVVVKMDRQSARRLGQNRNPERWSRELHARLVDRLRQLGAEIIAFDVFFAADGGATAEEDAALARSVGAAGNVVLTQRVERTVAGDRLRNPAAAITAGAAALAPFPLPKIPDRISYYWPFYPVVEPFADSGTVCKGDRGAGEAFGPGVPAGGPRVFDVTESATLPVAVVQLMVMRRIGSDGIEALREVGGVAARRQPPDGAAAFCELFAELRGRYRHGTPGRPGGYAGDMDVLDRALRSRGVSYLNFYGPPMSIATLRYADVLEQEGAEDAALRQAVRGSVVLVGAGDSSPIDQRDAFPSVFTTREGLHLAGVEIAATAVANLVDDSTVVGPPPAVALLIVALFGALVATTATVLNGASAVLVTLSAALGYGAFAWWQFLSHAVWLPLVTPMVVQLPAALILGQLVKYLASRAETRRYRGIAQTYLPRSAVRALVDEEEPNDEPRSAWGVCMITDVEGYSSVTAGMHPAELARLQNAYFERLEVDVQRGDGDVLRVEGDSLVALWLEGGERRCKVNACLAALAMSKSVERFNDQNPGSPFPTRFGLMAGEMVLGRVGGGGRYTFTGTGAVFVVAARLEAASKWLGTRILCGEPVVDGLSEIPSRCIGKFALKGRAEPETLFELIEPHEGNPVVCVDHRFSEALALFQAGHPAVAGSRFAAVAAEYPKDGPSRFYTALCRNPDVMSTAVAPGGIVSLDQLPGNLFDIEEKV